MCRQTLSATFNAARWWRRMRCSRSAPCQRARCVAHVLLDPECYLYCRRVAVGAHRGSLPEDQIVECAAIHRILPVLHPICMSLTLSSLPPAAQVKSVRT